jgi:hypothetical protein
LPDDVSGQEHLAAGDRRQHPGDGRVPTVAETNDEVVHPPEPPACAACNLPAEDQREVKDTRRLRFRSHWSSLVARIAKEYAARDRSPARRSGFVNRESKRAAE